MALQSGKQSSAACFPEQQLALEAAEPSKQVTFALSEGNIETIKHLQQEIGTPDIIGVFREGLRILRWAVEEWGDNRLIASIKDARLKVYPNLIEGKEV